MSIYSYNIEVSGTCNLQCAACARGSSNEVDAPKGFMDIALFEALLQKIKKESPGKETALYLFNWSEPFLHPQLPELVGLANKYGLSPHLSSNLVRPLNLKDVLKAKPQSLRVSLSGYYPEIYNQTHCTGDINLVKSNAYLLRYLMNQFNSTFPVEFCFLKYLHNMEQDYTKVKLLAQELDFNFIEAWAFFTPLEKLIQYYEGYLEKEHPVLDLLAIKPEEAMAVSLRQKPNIPNCLLRSNQTAINVDGSVALCCAVYSPDYNVSDNFLDQSHEQLQKAKDIHPMCLVCMKYAAYITYTYGGQEELNQIAFKRLMSSAPAQSPVTS